MKNLLKDLQIRILILSRGRSDIITTTNILPDWVEVLVPESEKELYSKRIKNPILTTPDNIIGLGMLRNWCIDNFSEESIIMIDDDITRCYCITSLHSKEISKDEIIEVLVNDCIMSRDLGTGVFGFMQTNIRKYNACEPFSLCTWVGGIIGVNGKDLKFRNDKYKVDIDFCLQNLLVHRVIFCDNRYRFCQYRDNNKGGNSLFRSNDDYLKSVETLKNKWGKYITVKNKSGSQISIKLNVKRKQNIKL